MKQKVLLALGLAFVLAGPAQAGDPPGSVVCTGESCPCDNDDADAGCANSTGSGAALAGSGSASVSADDLVLTGSSLPANQPAIFFRSANLFDPALPFGDGLLCLAPFYCRASFSVSSDEGVVTLGPGIVADSQTGPPLCRIDAGDTWNFQVWYRDPNGPCGGYFNSSNAYSVTFAD